MSRLKIEFFVTCDDWEWTESYLGTGEQTRVNIKAYQCIEILLIFTVNSLHDNLSEAVAKIQEYFVNIF